MEDLIQHVDTLFDERPSPSPPVPPAHVAETMSMFTSGSLFLSPEFPQPAEVQAMGSTSKHRPGLVGGIPTSTQLSFSSHSDADMESHLTPSPTALLSPPLELPSSTTLTEGVEMTTQEQVVPEVRGTEAVETSANSTLAEVVFVPPTSVAEWRLRQSRPPPHPEAPTIPQSPTESVLSGVSDFSLSPGTSLQTGMGTFSP